MAYVQGIIGPFTSLLLNSKSKKDLVIIGQLSVSFSQLPGTYVHAQGDLFSNSIDEWRSFLRHVHYIIRIDRRVLVGDVGM